MKKLYIFILTTILAFWVCGCSNSNNNILQETTSAETTAIVTTLEPTTLQPITEPLTKSFLELKNEYIERCEEYDYDEVMFAPERYISNYAKFEGKVIALCDDDGKWFVLQTDDGKFIDVKAPAQYYELNDDVIVYGKLADVIKPYYIDKTILQINAKYVEYK